MSVVPFGGSGPSRPPAHLPGGPWKLIPIATKDKRPLTPHGVKDATDDQSTLSGWWKRWPDANVGAAMGAPSGIWCLDVDPRNGGAESLEVLQDATGPWPVTWRSATGGGGQHFFFRLPPGVTIPNSSPMRGIDVLSDGKYVILPPSVHPSGIAYQWYFDEGPGDVELAQAPAALLERVASRAVQAAPAPTHADALLTAPRVQEIRSALAFLPADNRDAWLHRGAEIHSIAPNDQGYGIWCEWSQKSDKFDPVDQAKTWAGFKARPNQRNIESLFHAAYQGGWPGPPALETRVQLINDVPPAPASDIELPPLQSAHSAPGVLGDIVRFDLDSAPKPQPELALQGALALASVVLGRNYCTDLDNFPVLFLLNIAPSGQGKEHAKSTIEKILAAAQLERLVAGSYASAQGVFSKLCSQPAHIAFNDEFGRTLESAGRSAATHRTDALTKLMEVFGRAHGVLLDDSRSTNGLRGQEAEAASKRRVVKPHITFLATSTQEAFFEGITDRSVVDGFLNRFIIVESTQEAQVTRYQSRPGVPQAVLDWIHQIRTRRGGNLAGHVLPVPDVDPAPMVLCIQSRGLIQIGKLEARMIALGEKVRGEGLAAMLVRAHEIALRVALIVALARDPMADTVEQDDVQWAIDYVEPRVVRALEMVRERLMSPEAKELNKTRAWIIGRGPIGASRSELARLSPYRNIKPSMREVFLRALIESDEVCCVERKGQRGPVGIYYVGSKFLGSTVEQPAKGTDHN